MAALPDLARVFVLEPLLLGAMRPAEDLTATRG